MIEEAKLNNYYSAIADKLDEIIPCEWERIVMYAEELGNWSFATFYFYTNDGNVHHWGDISDEYDVNRRTVSRLVDELVEINKDLWLEFKDSGEEIWYSFTFDIKSEGKFNIKFGYEKNDELSGLEKAVRWAYDELEIIPRGKRGKKLLKVYLDEQKRDLPDELQDI